MREGGNGGNEGERRVPCHRTSDSDKPSVDERNPQEAVVNGAEKPTGRESQVSRRCLIKASIFAGLPTFGIARGTETARAADGDYISQVTLTNLLDQDGDYYFSNFDVSVLADTDLDTPYTRTTDPYFDVLVEGEKVAHKDIEQEYAIYDISISQSDLEDLNLDRGDISVTVELRNTQIGDNPLYDSAVDSLQYESESEDIPPEEQSLDSVQQLEDIYRRFSDQTLNHEFWHDQHMDSTEEVAKATAPIPNNGVDVSIELLSQAAGVHVSMLLDVAEATLHITQWHTTWRVRDVLKQGDANSTHLSDSDYERSLLCSTLLISQRRFDSVF
ncbi:hypothetical protein, partial [Natronoglomus mannanivorans]|nr:hypothetical protein [Halobacteria archaeon AArc-xg1-1]